MGQVLDGCARTTEAVRRAIQDSQESVRALARRYGVSTSTSTVQKWKKCRSVIDMPMGPKTPASTVLSSDEEAVIVAFRKHMLLGSVLISVYLSRIMRVSD